MKAAAQAGAPVDAQEATTTQQQQQHQQQQQDLEVLQVLLRTHISEPYARALLRPFHGTCRAGWAAALGTIRCLCLTRALRLPSTEEGGPLYTVSGTHLLKVLAAADQAPRVAINTKQLQPLLAALREQQQQDQEERHLQQALEQVSLGVIRYKPRSFGGRAGGRTSGNMFHSTSSSSSVTALASSSSSMMAPSSNSMCNYSSTSYVRFRPPKDSSRLAAAAAAARPQPTAAGPQAPPKPCGARLTTLGVEGDITAGIMQQLVALLDRLPRAQQLQHVELASRDALPAHGRYQFISWSCSEDVQAAMEGGATTTTTTTNSSSSSTGSSNSGGNNIITSSTTSSSRAVPSSTSASSVAATPRSNMSSWRDSCHSTYCFGAKRVRMADLAPLLESVQQLRALHLTEVRGTALPESAASSMQQLRLVDFCGVDFSGVDNMAEDGLWAGIARATHLQRLSVTSSDNMFYIPRGVGDLAHVTHLDLSMTHVTSSGLEAVCGMVSLREINLFLCQQLTSLPEAVGQLTNLRNLNLSWTGVHRLPASISALTGLRFLRWCYGGSRGPVQLEEVWGLRDLQHLSVCLRTADTSVPAALSQLTALTSVFVVGGSLEHMENLPATLAPLQQLQRLELKADALGQVPDSITTLTQLQEVSLRVEGGGLHLSPAVEAFVKARPITEWEGI